MDEGGFALNGSSQAQSFMINSLQTLSQGTLYGLTAKDVSVSATVDTGNGSTPSLVGGVIARAQDANNSYYAYVDGTGMLHLVKLVDGAETPLATAIPVMTGSHTIRLDVIGDTLNVYLDGSTTATLTATDSTYSSGTVGIRSAYQGVLFSNFSVSAGVAQGNFAVSNYQATADTGSPSIGSVNSTLTNVTESATILDIGAGGVALLAQWSGPFISGTSGTGYEALVLPSGTVSIIYVSGGIPSASPVATATLTLPTTPFALSFVVSGANMELLINGNVVASGTSTYSLTSGEAGILSVLGGSTFSYLVATGS